MQFPPHDPSRAIVLPPSPDGDGPAYVDGTAEMLAAAMEAPPSPGTLGRMELLHRWRTLSPEKRILLLHLARQMAGGR